MVRHKLVNRTVPPLLAALVLICIWYALDNRPVDPISPSENSQAKTSALKTVSANVVASDTAMPSPVPTVTKQGAQVQFSVNAAPLVHKHIQKVEFYVEKQFVGTAYSQPYAVAVSENNLSAGQHSVTAKIYTIGATTQTPPATFVAAPALPVAQPIDTSDADGAAVLGSTTSSSPTLPNKPSTPPPATQTIAAPKDLTVSASDNGTAATLHWSGSDMAVTYQVWRDGVQIAAVSDVSYSDTDLTPGQTYDYTIIALSANGAASAASSVAAVTMPVPQTTTETPSNTPKSAAANSEPNAADTSTNT